MTAGNWRSVTDRVAPEKPSIRKGLPVTLYAESRWNDMSERKNPNPGWVYLMWVVGTQRWKIGYSKDVATRWDALQSACPFPLRVVAAKRGMISDEQNLHIMFRKHRTHREWFDFDEPMAWTVLRQFGITFDHAYAVAHLL